MTKPTPETAYRVPRFHAKSRRWRLSINYPAKSGTKDFWWPAASGSEVPPPEVIAEAVQRQRHWQNLLKGWGIIGGIMAVFDPGRDWTTPSWVSEQQLADAQKHLDRENRKSEQEDDLEVARSLMSKGLSRLITNVSVPHAFGLEKTMPDAADRMRAAGRADLLHAYDHDREQQRVTLLAELQPAIRRRELRPTTVGDAIEAFIADQRERVNLRAGNGIRSETFGNTRGNLMRAFGSSAGKVTKKLRDTPIATHDLMHTLNRDRLVRFARFWQGPPEGVKSSRTVKNVFDAVRAFLKWAARQSYGFERIEDVADVLSADGTTKVAVEFAPALPMLLAVLRRGRDRLRAYALFALLLGYSPKDIATIRDDEIQWIDGEMYIKRERSKESGGSRRKRRGERLLIIRHWVAPELSGLIEKLRRQNPHGLLLLNRYGLPMYRTTEDGRIRLSAAAKAWDRARERGHLKDAPCFSQLRKLGYNAIKRHAGSREVADIWAGHSAAIGDHYDDGIFDPSVAAQRKWSEELRANLLL